MRLQRYYWLITLETNHLRVIFNFDLPFLFLYVSVNYCEIRNIGISEWFLNLNPTGSNLQGTGCTPRLENLAQSIHLINRIKGQKEWFHINSKILFCFGMFSLISAHILSHKKSNLLTSTAQTYLFPQLYYSSKTDEESTNYISIFDLISFHMEFCVPLTFPPDFSQKFYLSEHRFIFTYALLQ